MKTLTLKYRADKCDAVNKALQTVKLHESVITTIEVDGIDMLISFDEIAFDKREMLRVGILIGQTLATNLYPLK